MARLLFISTAFILSQLSHSQEVIVCTVATCQGQTLTAGVDGQPTEILGIECPTPLSCQGTTFANFVCPLGEECEIKCSGEPSMDMGSCEDAVFTNLEGFNKVSCEKEIACKNAEFSLVNATQDFCFECKELASCMGPGGVTSVGVTLIFPPDSTTTSIEGLKCEEEMSCAMWNFIITNATPLTITVETISCEEGMSCLGLGVQARGDREDGPDPLVEFEDVECEEADSCDMCTIDREDFDSDPVDCADFDEDNDISTTQDPDAPSTTDSDDSDDSSSSLLALARLIIEEMDELDGEEQLQAARAESVSEEIDDFDDSDDADDSDEDGDEDEEEDEDGDGDDITSSTDSPDEDGDEDGDEDEDEDEDGDDLTSSTDSPDEDGDGDGDEDEDGDDITSSTDSPDSDSMDSDSMDSDSMELTGTSTTDFDDGDVSDDSDEDGDDVTSSTDSPDSDSMDSDSLELTGTSTTDFDDSDDSAEDEDEDDITNSTDSLDSDSIDSDSMEFTGTNTTDFDDSDDFDDSFDDSFGFNSTEDDFNMTQSTEEDEPSPTATEFNATIPDGGPQALAEVLNISPLSGANQVDPASLVASDPVQGENIVCRVINETSTCADENVRGSEIAPIVIKNVECSGGASCSGYSFNLRCATSEECEILCDAQPGDTGIGVCEDAIFTISGDVLLIKCGRDGNACRNAQFIVTDPAEDFQLRCQGNQGCDGTQLTIIIGEDNTGNGEGVLEISGISCEASDACDNLEVSITNNNPALNVVVQELICVETDACNDIAFDFSGDGTVTVNNCDLGGNAVTSSVADACFVNGLEELDCNAALCQGQTYTITNPAPDFELKCGDTDSCNGLTLMIVFTSDIGTTVSSITGFIFDGTTSGKDATIVIQNDQANGLEIEEVDCGGIDSCDGLRITAAGDVTVSDGVNCGDLSKCDGCTVLGADCFPVIPKKELNVEPISKPDTTEPLKEDIIDIITKQQETEHESEPDIFNNKEDNLGLDTLDDDKDYWVTVDLSDTSLVQIWIMFGATMICNVLVWTCCWYRKKKTNQIQIPEDV